MGDQTFDTILRELTATHREATRHPGDFLVHCWASKLCEALESLKKSDKSVMEGAVVTAGTVLTADADELRELRRLFELQHTRTAEATAYWRKHTSREDANEILPDLGDLLHWLVVRCKVYRYGLRSAAWSLFQLKRISTPAGARLRSQVAYDAACDIIDNENDFANSTYEIEHSDDDEIKETPT